MNDPIPVRRPTPAEVLHALRHFAQFNSDEPIMWPEVEPITAATTVAEYQLRRDSSGALGGALNDFLGTSLSGAEWNEVLGEPRRKTVGGLCAFLAERVALTPRERFGVLGRPCEAGAIFLTLKASLAASGQNVRDLAPSTPIARYARNYPSYCVLVRDAVRIAPALLPLSEPALAGWLVALGKLSGCGLIVLTALGLLVIGRGPVLAGLFVGAIVAGVLQFFAAFALGCVEGWNRIPGVTTFRDLCKVLAGESTERPTRTKGPAL